MRNHLLTVMLLGFFASSFSAYRSGDTLKVYFLGNSVTNSGTSRTDEFKRFANACGIKSKVVLADYGAGLANHLANSKTMAAIRDTLWDYVIFQGQSNETADSINFKIYARLLVDTIRAAGATPILYITHSYMGGGEPIYDSALGAWQYTMQDRINKVYLDLATEKHCYVAPVGFAHGEIRRYHPEYLLYNDYVHSNPAGGYIHGSTIFSAITGINPVGLPNIYNLDTAMIHAIQCAAWKACLLDTLVPFIIPWKRPLRPLTIAFHNQRDSMECYLRRSFPVYPHFIGDSVGGAVRETIFRTLTPAVAGVDPFGVVTALKTGTARIEAEYYDRRDTLELAVVPNTAVYDSIRIFPHRAVNYITDAYQFKAMGFCVHQGQALQVDFTPVVNWISSEPSVFSAAYGKITKLTAQGGPMFVTVEKDGLRDTAYFTLAQTLPVLERINFQSDDTLFNSFWKPDWGQAYDDSLGYGWVNTPNTVGVGKLDQWSDPNLFLTNSYVYAKTGPGYSDPMGEGTWRIKIPDGDYIVKMGIGRYYVWGGNDSWVMFQTDTLCKHTGTKAQPVLICKDTLRVRGEQGLFLKIFGSIDYVVVATLAGVDIDSVAYDTPPLPLTTVAEHSIDNEQTVQIRAYPNPFNPRVTVELVGVKKGEIIRAALFDVSGKAVFRPDWTGLANARFTWDAGGLPSGIYVLKVRYAGKEVTHRMTLLR